MELLKNKKLQYQFFGIMALFITWVIYEIWHKNHLIDSNPITIEVPISEREVDSKGNVSIYADYLVNQKEYRAVDVVTGAEQNNNFTFSTGDTISVEYYKNDPSVNRIRIRKINYYR